MSIGPEDKILVILDGEIRTPPLSHAARLEAGRSLRILQRHVSLGMPLSRPMPLIGPRCHELRIRDADHSWRIDERAVVVAGILDKKTQETPKHFIELCKKRLRDHDGG